MLRISSRYVKLAVVAGIVLLCSTMSSAPVSGAEGQQCETCWNEYFSWNWHHNFPENDGQWNCDSGDGCHGSYYAEDTCDEAGHQYPCAINDDELQTLYALAYGEGDLGDARDIFQKSEGAIELDSESGLMLVAGCTGEIVASIPLTGEQIATLNN